MKQSSMRKHDSIKKNAIANDFASKIAFNKNHEEFTRHKEGAQNELALEIYPFIDDSKHVLTLRLKKIL